MYWKLDGLLIAFPLLAYGFTSQQFVFGVYQSLRAPTVQRMTSVVKQVPPDQLPAHSTPLCSRSHDFGPDMHVWALAHMPVRVCFVKSPFSDHG